MKLYRDALPDLCTKHGVLHSAFVELTARYYPTISGGNFELTVVDRQGRRSSTEYSGFDGARLKEIDGEGRLRPKPVRRST